MVSYSQILKIKKRGQSFVPKVLEPVPQIRKPTISREHFRLSPVVRKFFQILGTRLSKNAFNF
jgi:hypothetical protein